MGMMRLAASIPVTWTLQIYWDDNADKLNHFVQILSAADYIIIPTNHQYAQITRIPERYPLTTYYYRELLGCPVGADIIKCYETAQPGQYEGRLGFELVKVFESYPTFGSLVINDQSAEEAFTFYDHPKVLIFQKTDNFDADETLRFAQHSGFDQRRSSSAEAGCRLQGFAPACCAACVTTRGRHMV